MEEELRRLKDELAASEQRVIEAEERAAAAEAKAQENATMTQEIRMLQQENDMLLLQTNEPSQVMSAQNPTLRINWTNSLRYEEETVEQHMLLTGHDAILWRGSWQERARSRRGSWQERAERTTIQQNGA